MRSVSLARMVGSKTAIRLRPRDLASCMAASASPISSSGSLAELVMVRPTLIEIPDWLPG